jgi:DUF1707 SHOCT-like domain
VSAGRRRTSALDAYSWGWRSRDGDLLLTDEAREQAASTVRQALAEGSLTVGEAEHRLELAYAARRKRELVPVLEDLPQHVVRHSRHRRRTRRLRAIWIAVGVVVAVTASSLLSPHTHGGGGHPGSSLWALWPIAFLVWARVFWWRGRRTHRWGPPR